MKYVTNRLVLDAFEYEPYGLKPEWFIKMVECGKAFEYKKTNNGEIKNNKEWRKFETGDKLYIDENMQVGIIPAALLSKYCKPLDENREEAVVFNKKIDYAIETYGASLKTGQ